MLIKRNKSVENMMSVRSSVLVRPSVAHHHSFLEALAERRAEERNVGIHRPACGETFDEFVARLLRMDDPAHVEPAFAPHSVFWLVDGGAHVGRLSLRHHLNDDLRSVGGYIGYDVRPGMRGHGYGTRILALWLDEARRIGLNRVLLTCREGNLASRRVIERNGDQLSGSLLVPDAAERTLHYWSDL